MSSDHNEMAAGTSDHDRDRDREHRLLEILADYFEAVEAGRAPDRAGWLARYPDWADEIAVFLDEQDRLLRLTEPLRPATAATPVVAAPPDGTADRPPGTRIRYIGDYELLDEIARGGIGVVFRARQRSLNRPVALKMLRAEDLASDADEHRFRREAEAAANLDHPQIVPIFEVGRHLDRSYFSMKLVEGGSLSRRLPEFVADPRASARLLAMVARAVHHAHQRGVLHRDLKPGNILLGGGPGTPIGEVEPYVTDFGLARRVEGEPALTQTGEILGTPAYMAPEQAVGRRAAITVATDVYGLGAVLYAMLTGRPPFRGDSVLETLARVRDGDVEPPSRRGRRIDRDLETICLKCLEREPSRRFATAEAVAEDLERWRAGVPIRARPAGHLERGWRWCRRNPAVAALAVVVVLFVSVTLVGLATSNRTIARERDEARRQRQRSDRYARTARHAVDQMYTRFAEDWLANQPRLEPLQYQFLAMALRAYEEFAEEGGDGIEVRRDVAVALRRIGEIRFKLGDQPEAEAALRRSVQAFRDPRGPGRWPPQDRLQWVESELALDRVLRRRGSAAEAADAAVRAVGIARQLIAEAPGRPDYRLALADALVHLESEPALREALATLADPEVEASDPDRSRRTLGDAHAHLGSVLFDRGRPGDGLPHHREALRIRAEVSRGSPANYASRRRLLSSTTDLARDLEALGRLDEAVAADRDGLTRARELAGQFPSIPDNLGNIVFGLCNLGGHLTRLGRLDEAEAHFREGLERARGLEVDHPGIYHDPLGAALLAMGRLLIVRRRPGEARATFEQVLALHASDSKMSDARDRVARLMVLEPAGAPAEVARALELARLTTERFPAEPQFWSTLGLARFRAGRWEEALRALDRSAELGGDGPVEWLCRAMAHGRAGDRDASYRWYGRATDGMAGRRIDDPDARRLLAEAELLLGIADARMPDGPDAFAPE